MNQFSRFVYNIVSLCFISVLLSTSGVAKSIEPPLRKELTKADHRHERPGVPRPSVRRYVFATGLLPIRPLPVLPVSLGLSIPKAVDPIRFWMQANKTSVRLNEEFEITISAELLPILSSQMFFFENQRSFSVKVLMPDGFVQTGGTYTEYISSRLSELSPNATYTIIGKYTDPASNYCFSLLRGDSGAIRSSSFIRKAELCVEVSKSKDYMAKLSAEGRQVTTTFYTVEQTGPTANASVVRCPPKLNVKFSVNKLSYNLGETVTFTVEGKPGYIITWSAPPCDRIYESFSTSIPTGKTVLTPFGEPVLTGV